MPLDVSILILEAVGVLHSRGHQLLRIHPGMSGSGMYWRTAISRVRQFHRPRWLHPPERLRLRVPLHDRRRVRGRRRTGGRRPRSATELADRIVATPSGSRSAGVIGSTTGWYVELLGLVRRHRAHCRSLYADYFDDERGMGDRLGGSGRRIPHGRRQQASSADRPSSSEHPQRSQHDRLVQRSSQFDGTLGLTARAAPGHEDRHQATVGGVRVRPCTRDLFDAAHIARPRTNDPVFVTAREPGEGRHPARLTCSASRRASRRSTARSRSAMLGRLCKSCSPTQYDSSPRGESAASQMSASAALPEPAAER